MSNLLQFTPLGIKRQQIFTSSGTFTPSARLLALGGWVEVLCVGGGGGGYFNSENNVRNGGGAGQVVRRVVQVTGNVTVTIGAGGIGGDPGSSGGNTTFGSLVTAAGGHGTGFWAGGSSDWYSYSNSPGGAGQNSSSQTIQLRTFSAYAYVGFGGGGIDGYGIGGAGTSDIGIYTPSYLANGLANTGQGGHFGGNGGSGICIVEWWE